jgi:hypothetical protein
MRQAGHTFTKEKMKMSNPLLFSKGGLEITKTINAIGKKGF